MNEDLQDMIYKQYIKTIIVEIIMLVVLFAIYSISKGILFTCACVFALIAVSTQACKLLRLAILYVLEKLGDLYDSE